MACEYNYASLYDVYMQKINEIFLGGYNALDPISDFNKPEFAKYNDRPVKVYSDGPTYVQDCTTYYSANNKRPYFGFIVWDSKRYYDATYIQDIYKEYDVNNTSQGIYPMGLWIVPEFGQARIARPEYKQTVTISFDTFTDPDYDRFGVKSLTLIDWFMTINKEEFEDVDCILPSGTPYYVTTDLVTGPIYNDKVGNYQRRTITTSLRYCIC